MTNDHVVVSADGTRIAAGREGSGPPVVLVHGAIGDRTSFRLLAPLLAARFEVLTVDRRGHGASGDSGGAYAIEQEFADVAEVVDSLAEPATVVGHSFGATVALGAAALTARIRALVLYEPSPGIQAASPGLLACLDDLIARDQREDALALALTEFAGFGPDDLEAYRASPLWAPRVAAAHTIPREVRAEEDYLPDWASFATVNARVLYVLGSASPEWARRGAELIASLVPRSRTAVLEGQGHMATVTAPELLAAEITRFVEGP
ncbi:MAG TPA: alpha/beta hydrolase [Candidatus Limnocylindrales bacterium]|nr:alpha/beta hydrolase [Candidatus Limnocylindrales bacterium]